MAPVELGSWPVNEYTKQMHRKAFMAHIFSGSQER